MRLRQGGDLQNNTGNNKLATAQQQKTLGQKPNKTMTSLRRFFVEHRFTNSPWFSSYTEAEMYCFNMREDNMALLHKPQLLFDVFSSLVGLGLSPPSPPPSPLLTQLVYGF